ncbi:PQQ-like beta-propeller repeat protein [Candidatus Woesearchaeota archaeon]|nr:PQQ-like beta-propeller repeat protein [Candidatus Woesearchaeota archaeon]
MSWVIFVLSLIMINSGVYAVVSSASIQVQSPDAEWNKTFGGSGNDYGYSVQQASDGGYIVAGETSSFGAGNFDVYLLKTDPDGKMQWNKTFGGSNYDYGYSVQQTNDGGYIVAGGTSSFGAGNSDVYLLKTDPDGKAQWNKTFGGSNYDYGYSVQQTNDGGYIITGSVNNTLSPYSGDAYLIKTNSDGTIQWNRTFGDPGNHDSGYSVQQTNDGGYIIAGYIPGEDKDVYLIKTDSAGKLQWSKTIGGEREDYGYSVKQTSDGGYIVAGEIYPISALGQAAGQQVYLLKVNASGKTQWNKSFGVNFDDAGRSVLQASDGGYIVAGNTNEDVYLVKVTLNGSLQWNKTFRSINNSFSVGTSAHQTDDGGFIVAGYISSGPFGGGNYNVYLIKLQREGSCSDNVKNGNEESIDCGGSCQIGCLNDISISNLTFNSGGNLTIVFKAANNGASDVNGLKAKFIDKFSGQLIKEKTETFGFRIYANSSRELSTSWDVERGHEITVILDPDNNLNEVGRIDNIASKLFFGLTKYYLRSDVPPDVADIEIAKFLKGNIPGAEFVTASDDADVEILVARHNPLIVWHFSALEENGWGFQGGGLRFQDKFCNKPYCAVVGSKNVNGKQKVAIEANDIEGFIAGAKEFAANKEKFISREAAMFLGEEYVPAIGVFDFLHNSFNKAFYKQNSTAFASLVKRALEDDMQDEDQVNATVNGVNLRLLHLKPAYSENFTAFRDEAGLPVVLGHGLWSNLDSWKDFGVELASEEGKDTWLIEITGGPDTDCAGKETDDCPNYNFSTLTDEYVPALLNKVISSTNKSKLQYVGFSNGCRSVLSSLEKGEFDANKVETFVGVGCPGAFNGSSIFSELVDNHGSNTLANLNNKSVRHVTLEKVRDTIIQDCGFDISCQLGRILTGEGNFISFNLLSNYFAFIQNKEDGQPGKNLELDNFAILFGSGLEGSDGIVTKIDAIQIYDQVNANKTLLKVFATHKGIEDKDSSKDLIIKLLNKQEFGFLERNLNLVNSSKIIGG